MVRKEEAEEEEDQVSFPQLRATQERLEPVESIVPLITVDPKGKAPENSSSKPKKSKSVKAATGEPKKTKVIAFAILATKTTEACS